MPRGQETLFCTTPIPLLPLSIPWFPTEREKLVLHCRGIFLGGSPRGGPDLPTTSVGCTLDTSTQPAVTQVTVLVSGVCPKGWQFWSDLLHGYGWKRIQGSGKPVPLCYAALRRRTVSVTGQAFSWASSRKQPFQLQGKNFALRSLYPFSSCWIRSPGGTSLTLTDPLCIMDLKAEILCSDCQTLCRQKDDSLLQPCTNRW